MRRLTWERENPEIFALHSREVSRINRLAILYLAASGLIFCLFDVIAQILTREYVNLVMDGIMLCYHLLCVFIYTKLKDDNSWNTKLLYILQVVPIVSLIAANTAQDPFWPEMTVFIFIMPLLIFDRRERVYLWTLLWTIVYMVAYFFKMPMGDFERTLLHCCGFCTASVITSGILNAWREAKLENYIADMSRSYDLLTGLPNFYQFLDMAGRKAKEIFARADHPVLIYFNITNLKIYNARSGFEKGSLLMKKAAEQIRTAFAGELAGRAGQDHFVVLCEREQAEESLYRLFHEMGELDEETGASQLKAGMYELEKDEEIGTACDRAKTAADSIRKSPDVPCREFDELFKREVEKRQYILQNVDRAVHEGWIETWYQPVVRSSTGELCSEEALIRWNDPELGRIQPDDFVPVLEDNRLIYKIDLCNIANILRDLKNREKNGMFINPVSVNLSRTDFTQLDMCREIMEMADKAGIDHRYLIIEITESALAERSDFLREIINGFREHGFQVWIDDFGSGYSALNLLDTFQFDLLKFDAYFTRTLKHGSRSEIILSTIVDMANRIGVETLAEGVETEEQYDILKTIGVSKLQGYYFSSPNPLKQVMNKYRNGTMRQLESPVEAEYFDKIGKINLNEPVRLGDGSIPDQLRIVPSAVLEMDEDGNLEIIRANRGYMCYFEDRNKADGEDTFSIDPAFVALCEEAVGTGSWASNSDYFKQDGRVPTFVRYLGENPITGKKALVASVLYGGGIRKE